MSNQPLSIHSNKCYVFSDLHLAEGNLGSGIANGTENFFSDDEFSALLEYLSKVQEKSAIIFNGDFVDFIRITSCPTPDEISIWQQEINLAQKNYITVSESNINNYEREVGLKTHDYKTVWKLYKAIEGHKIFFEAIAKWVDGGNEVYVSRGNHDPEWIWLLVQDYFREKLFALGISDKKENFEKGIHFINDENFVLNDIIHVEHGHKHELLTKLQFESSKWDIIIKDKNDKTPDRNPENQILLPVGSFYNRYIVNQVEKDFPHLDNLSISKALRLAFTQGKIISIIKMFINLFKYSGKILAKEPSKALKYFSLRYLILLGFPIFFTLKIYSIWGKEFMAKYIDSIPMGIPLFLFNVLSIIAFIIIFLVITSIIKKIAHFTKFTNHTLARESLDALKKTPHLKYIIVGHNHNAKLILEDDRTYVNTGTWTSKYVDKLEAQQNGVVYAFAEITKDSSNGVSVKLNEWLPQLNISRELTSFNHA